MFIFQLEAIYICICEIPLILATLLDQNCLLKVPTPYLWYIYCVPTAYLQRTYNVPTMYLQCTHKIPLKTPAWKPQPFPSCLNAHNFGNKDYRCRELVSQHRLLPPTYPQTPFFLNPFPHNLILFKQLTYCCYVKH